LEDKKLSVENRKEEEMSKQHLNPNKDKKREPMSAAAIAAILVVVMAIGMIAQNFGIPFLEAIGGAIITAVLIVIALWGGRVGVGFIFLLFAFATLGSLWWWFRKWAESWPIPEALTPPQVTQFNWVSAIAVMFIIMAIGSFASMKWRWPSTACTAIAAGVGALILGELNTFLTTAGMFAGGIFLATFLTGVGENSLGEMKLNVRLAVLGVMNTFQAFFINNLMAWGVIAFGRSPEEVVCIIAGAMVGAMFVP